MSAFGGKADVRELPSECLLIAKSGHPTARSTTSGLVVLAPDKTQVIVPDPQVGGFYSPVASITLTINVNEIILPTEIESLIIIQVTMMHWGILWLLHYHSINLKSFALLKR